MSRGLYRGVYTSLIDDPDFQALHPHAKLVFYTARLCKDAGPAAIFRYYPGLLAMQSGLPLREIETRLHELEAGDWIVRDGPVLWIKNGLRHDPTTTTRNPHHRKSIIRWLDSLPHVPMLAKFAEYYDLPIPIWMGTRSPTHSPPDHRIPKNLEVSEESGNIRKKQSTNNDHVVLTDDQFISSLQESPAYQHLDVPTELARMDAWLMVHHGRQKTRRFIVGWLNRQEKPVTAGGAETLPGAISDKLRASLPGLKRFAEKGRGDDERRSADVRHDLSKARRGVSAGDE